MAGYGSDNGLEAWAEENGYTLPAQPAPAVLRQRAAVYLDGQYGARFPGAPTGGFAQERAWPRNGAETIYGEAIASDAIPSAVIQASYAAAYYEGENPGGLAVAVTPSGAIKREKVGPLETEYFEGSGDAVKDGQVVLPEVEGLLAPFLAQVGLPAAFVV